MKQKKHFLAWDNCIAFVSSSFACFQYGLLYLDLPCAVDMQVKWKFHMPFASKILQISSCHIFLNFQASWYEIKILSTYLLFFPISISFKLGALVIRFTRGCLSHNVVSYHHVWAHFPPSLEAIPPPACACLEGLDVQDKGAGIFCAWWELPVEDNHLPTVFSHSRRGERALNLMGSTFMI